jgi:hypothetical protein
MTHQDSLPLPKELFPKSKIGLTASMESSEWLKHEVGWATNFFISLNLHPVRSGAYGLKMMPHYQENVHIDWVTRI